MCGIFGVFSKRDINIQHFKVLSNHAAQRGQDSSGLMLFRDDKYEVHKSDSSITKLIKNIDLLGCKIAVGHSRLITNGNKDNQPVIRDGVLVFHNGIVVNSEEIWNKLTTSRSIEIDSEVIAAITNEVIDMGINIDEAPKKVLDYCEGTISSFVAAPKLGKGFLFSNFGSLFVGYINDDIYFASEKFPLIQIGCSQITQIWSKALEINLPVKKDLKVYSEDLRRENLIPSFKNILSEENRLLYRNHNLRRCTKCILPETMPFINFDNRGVCNFCRNYIPRNKPKPKDEILKLIEGYRRKNDAECIVPFSGGRDSCWGLHIVVNELELKPITYTYEWGMITDLGRRNISRMCAKLGVENIIIADDISKKRRNITLNLKAWLKSPHLGMISILTAGDKKFFQHINTVKAQTGINLNLWGINPLEVTHFKAGFLGIKPDFEEKRVYSSNWTKQFKYQSLRFKEMMKSPRYFNQSLWDTFSGEYYRSFNKKADYFHIFDYWQWEENACNRTLNEYDWEMAPDTNTSWRIGDGTAAFYNYIYYTFAGFTEHDTFRSNQIREGQISRKEALSLVLDENKPRYQNIRWYLDTLGLSFDDVISKINSLERSCFPESYK